jgi:sulfofructosephosphate aldolase
MNRGLPTLDRLARPSGTFAMVAIDQRESLRTMFAERMSGPIDLDTRVAFKIAVARLLSPHASAMLVDPHEGLDPMLEAEALDPRCALIVAADSLTQEPGGLVEDTALDAAVDLQAAAARGAVAAKLLVIWRPEGSEADRAALVREFLAKAHAGGLLGIVEGVVRAPNGMPDRDWADREAAILEAARELGNFRPDLYKAQVPFDGTAAQERITEACQHITAALPCPWVVLSSGVAIDAFPGAVHAAGRGGASGFLAGRAIWRDAIGADPDVALRDRAVPRLVELGHIVDRAATPWTRAANGAWALSDEERLRRIRAPRSSPS